MGAYLSQPKTDKVSTDELNELLVVGASSMQGWRNSQEDAHNAILNFDKHSSFFAVYDGHGGAEVATYCADKLPEFLKELASYKAGAFEQALKDAFLSFDRTLLEPQVVEVLKILAGEKNIADAEDSDAADGDDDDEDLAELHEESNLPLNEVLEKYKGAISGCGPSMPALKKVKESGIGGAKPQSPYLRGRRAAAVAADAANKAVMDPDVKPQGSSTSAAAAAAVAGSSCDAGPSSSKSTSSSASKMDTDEPEEDSTVSSSSSSASKSNNNNNNTVSAVNTEAEASVLNATEKITTNGASSTSKPSSAPATTNSCTPDSSHVKESEQNGSVTSSEAKVLKADVSTSSAVSAKPLVGDATVSGSSDSAARGKQNGSIASSSNAPQLAIDNIELAAISSTSKAVKKGGKHVSTGEEDSTDDDADYDAENSSPDELEPVSELGYSSPEDLDDEDDEDDEDDDDDNADEDEDEEDDEEEEDEDEESALANEQFCANMIEEPGKDSGCTAVVALLQGRDLYVANAGDSRCVVCRNGKAIEMSLDHKPEDDEESARIIKAGGRVTLDGRVNGGLNLSRAIGDHAYKMNLELLPEEQMISALPDIKKLIIMPEDEFMVLACDGIWNYMSSEEVVDFVRLRVKDESKELSQICEELFDNCLAPNTMGDGTGCDNMTAVIVRFQPKLMELTTAINPNEAEDVLSAKRAADADAADVSLQKSLKRCASHINSDDNSNEAVNANKTKRLKTDVEASTSATTTNENTAAAATEVNALSSNNVASSSISNSASASIEQKECDSVSTAASSNTSSSSNGSSNEAATVSST